MTIDEATLYMELYKRKLFDSVSDLDKDIEAYDVAIDIMRKYQQLEDFAKWVAVEVIDEELWTFNYLAFAEIACRKLVQLGIMQESDGEYTYEVEDGNDTHRVYG